jgi:hypothetical protein
MSRQMTLPRRMDRPVGPRPSKGNRTLISSKKCPYQCRRPPAERDGVRVTRPAGHTQPAVISSNAAPGKLGREARTSAWFVYQDRIELVVLSRLSTSRSVMS